VPAYNAAQTIRATLRSVLNQSWGNVEVVVIDDGSTDGTGDIAREFAGPMLNVISRERHGAAAARNAGLDAVRGQYIQFLDADDILSPAKLESQITALEMATDRSIASCAWAHFEGDPTKALLTPEPVWPEPDPIEWLVKSLSGQGMMQPGAWLTPRVVIDAAGRWNESLSLHDDGEFFARVLLKADQNVFVPGAFVYYRSVSDSLSRQRSSRAVESALAVCESRHQLLLAVRDDDAARRAVATQYAQFAYEFCKTNPGLAHKALVAIEAVGAKPLNNVGGATFRRIAGSIGFARALELRSRLS
jgi:glycosyltransferase involved in cell wall biosynthesis